MRRRQRSCRARVLCCALCVGVLGCALETPWPDPKSEPASDAVDSDAASGAPFRIATWNLTWFQDPSRPPEDSAQAQGAFAALDGLRPDIVGLQEIASVAGFAALRDALGYQGVLGERSVPQRLALLYQPKRFSLIEATELTGLADAGRPPLDVRLFDEARGEPLRVVVLHAKANAEPASHATRKRFADGLHERLRAVPSEAEESMPLIVVGDFNDGLERSIAGEPASPYAAWLVDWAAPTRELELRGEASTVWGGTVDHVLVDRVLEGRLEAGAAHVLRDDGPLDVVSDHFPVYVELR